VGVKQGKIENSGDDEMEFVAEDDVDRLVERENSADDEMEFVIEEDADRLVE